MDIPIIIGSGINLYGIIQKTMVISSIWKGEFIIILASKTQKIKRKLKDIYIIY